MIFFLAISTILMAINFYVFLAIGFNIYLLFLLTILEVFFLGSIAGNFSKPKEPESSSRITTIQNHVDDLKNYNFRPLDLKQTHFEMLEQIANLINKNIVETNESIIESLYSELIKSGELKIRKVA